MDSEPEVENDLRSLQMESFGRLMAGFSHEMKNHLGIIRESNGLVGDVLEFQGISGGEATLERLKKAVDAIERRIVMAAEMLHHLSGFAHRSDTPCSSFHINELLIEECTFLQRFARLKKVEFELRPGEGISPLYTDPSLVQHMVYRLFIFCLERVDAGRRMELVTFAEGDGVMIRFLLPETSLIDLDGDILRTVAPAVEALNATLSPDDGHSLTLSLSAMPVDNG